MAYINGKKVISRVICNTKVVVNDNTPLEIADPIEMEAVLIVENLGKIYKYVGETNETFTNGAIYQIVEE